MFLKKFLAIFIAIYIFSLGSLTAQQYSTARIYAERSALGALGLAVDHVHDGGNYIEGDFSKFEIELAKNAGYQVSIIAEDAELTYSLRTKNDYQRDAEKCIEQLNDLDYTRPINFTDGKYRGHFTYSQMQAELDKMADLYPNLVSKRVPVGSFLTEEGRPIEWLKISDHPDREEMNEPQMLYTALHHAREPISLTQLIYFMWYLLEQYSQDPAIKFLLDNVELYFIPCVNPDGYVYNEMVKPEGGGLWRKNRRNNGDGTFGVDLNRNYGHQWGHDNAGSSGATNSEVYRGPAPFSEPETQAVKAFVESHSFKLALNYHSWGGFLIYPFGYTPQPAEDVEVFKELGNLLTRENRYIYGTGLETVAYPTNGDADDWMYGNQDGKESIFSMTPEIGSEEHSFWPVPEDVEYLCQLTLKQNLSAAYFLLNSALVFDESESYLTEKQGSLPFSLTKLGFEEVAFALSFQPLTDNIEFTNPSKLYIINLFGNQQDYLDYTLSSDIQDGERIKFAYTIDNGSYSRTDTFIKYYRDARFALNNSGEKSSWVTNSLLAQWNETDKLYVSAPTSLTDSPSGNTIPYTTNHLTLRNPVPIFDGDSAILTFRAYWDMQNQYDYMLVEVSTDQRNFTPLCGHYSVAGKLNINKDLPIYTGRQLSWIIERIDLSAYVGEEVTLRFTMRSTKDDTRDGIYLDDIRILEYNQGDITQVNNIQESLFNSELFPNPARHQVAIKTDAPEEITEFSRIEFINQLGVRVHQESLRPNISVDISSWSPGLYYYRLIDEKGKPTMVKKLLIN